MFVFEDLGFLIAICMYPQIGCKMSVDKREAALSISMLFTLFYFCPSDRRLNNCVMNYLCDLLFALSLEYNIFNTIFVYLLQYKINARKRQFPSPSI